MRAVATGYCWGIHDEVGRDQVMSDNKLEEVVHLLRSSKHLRKTAAR